MLFVQRFDYVLRIVLIIDLHLVKTTDERIRLLDKPLLHAVDGSLRALSSDGSRGVGGRVPDDGKKLPSRTGDRVT